MHETETLSENYGFYRLDNVAMDADHGPDGLDHMFGYLSSRGAVSIDGAPVSLAEVPAEGRRWQALDQSGIQEYARSLFAPGTLIEDFVHENITDEQLRRSRTDSLHDSGIPFVRDDVIRIDGYGDSSVGQG